MTTINTNSPNRSYTITGVNNNVTYKVRVAAVNSIGTGPFTEYVFATPSEFSTDEYYYDNTLLMHFDDSRTGTFDQYGDQVSLLMHMDGANDSTIFVDSSLHNRNITVNGPAKLSSNQSKFGGTSAAFDADTSYLRVASGSDFAFPSDFTIECWVYFTNSSRGYQGIIGAHSGSDQTGWVLYLETNNILTFNSGAGSGWAGAVSSGETVTPNEWHHIAVSRFGSSLRIFIDGTLKGTITSNVNIASGSIIDIGDYTCLNQYGYNFTMSGYIDELRITKGIARYTENFTPSSTAFPAVLPLFVDSSAYQRRVTSYGNAALSNAQSKFGNSSVYFDGSGDYLEVANDSSLDFGSEDFTIEYWEYRVGTGTSPVMCRFRTGNGLNPWLAGYNGNGTLQFYMSTNDSGWNMVSALSMGSPIYNIWSHYAVVKENNTIRTYQNGNQIATTTTNLSTAAGSGPLSIGRHANNGSDYYEGYLDDIRITKGVARYSSNFSVPVAPSPDLGIASTVPSTPSNLTVSEDQGIVSLSWSRPSYPRVIDTRAPITYYGVEYSSDNGSSWTEHSVVSGGSLLTRSISGLPSNTPYLFRVRAQNSVGFGNYSSTANISTLTNTPSGVSAIPDNNQAYVSWTAPTPNNSSIRDYSVQYSSDAGSSWTTFSHSPSIDTLINVTGLNNSSDYVFKVAAVNLAGIGTYSSNSSSINVAPRTDNLYNKTRILLHLDSN